MAREKEQQKRSEGSRTVRKTRSISEVIPDEVIDLITDSVDDLSDDSGYALLSRLGDLLLKKQPDFDPRNYGFSKLSKMINALDCFESKTRDESVVYVRARPSGK